MKRSLNEMQGEANQNGRTYANGAEGATAEGALYDDSMKKRKLEN